MGGVGSRWMCKDHHHVTNFADPHNDPAPRKCDGKVLLNRTVSEDKARDILKQKYDLDCNMAKIWAPDERYCENDPKYKAFYEDYKEYQTGLVYDMTERDLMEIFLNPYNDVNGVCGCKQYYYGETGQLIDTHLNM